MRVPGVGPPRQVLEAALVALETEELYLEAVSPIVDSAPLGPSLRRYANAAAVAATDLSPPDVLALLQRLECAFGRRRRGGKWRARTLDLDIVLWSGGVWRTPALRIPHYDFRTRAFVLGPAAAVAANWRDPLNGLTLLQQSARLTRHRPLPR